MAGTTTLRTWSRSRHRPPHLGPGTHRNLIRAHAYSRPVLLSWHCLHVNLLITSANHHTTKSWNSSGLKMLGGRALLGGGLSLLTTILTPETARSQEHGRSSSQSVVISGWTWWWWAGRDERETDTGTLTISPPTTMVKYFQHTTRQ